MTSTERSSPDNHDDTDHDTLDDAADDEELHGVHCVQELDQAGEHGEQDTGTEGKEQAMVHNNTVTALFTVVMCQINSFH